MRLRRIINAPKVVIDPGAWKVGVKMPKTAFPLSKATNFKIPSNYNWRVLKFDCEGEHFRVLIAYRMDLERYVAYLAMEVGSDMKVLGRYEYHATEPGWHMHAVCDSRSQVAGRQGTSDKRIP